MTLFLDPEIVKMVRFLDPEISKMVDRSFINEVEETLFVIISKLSIMTIMAILLNDL